jgi:type VI secretion system secreted protein VgrG
MADKSFLSVDTPFGKDALVLARMDGEERLSTPFRFDLDLVSKDASLDFKKILGQGVTVKIALSSGKDRVFHGIATRFVQAGRAGKLTAYRAELRPRLWVLSKTRDSRVFQAKTVPEIVKAVLSAHGVDPVVDKLKAKYEKREYCVQYQESALDFISRLLEDEGIFYYFQHAEGKHTLVLGDDPTAHAPCPELAKARYRGPVEESARDEDAITACEIEEQVTTTGYAVSDYNFEVPATSLLSKIDGEGGLEVYEYPGNHAQKSAGEARAKLRLEAEEATASFLTGSSYCRGMSAGHAFTLADHERKSANTDYVVLSVTHAVTGTEYDNAFVAFPKKKPYRPPRLTPKPLIHGAQTAVVTGKSGEEIWTDKYGRIKVQFFWDRLGAKDDKSSCWVRVAQGWAGKGWGAFFLPRVGQEVVVTFLGGDPDRPLVTGSVYNAEQTVPYGLPGEQTKSTLKTRSSKQGSAGNELRFEDKKDAEEVFLHAEKDQKFTVKHDFATEVENDLTTTVKKGKRTTTLDEGDDTLVVKKGGRTVKVEKGDETHSVKGKRTVKVEGEEAHETKGAVKVEAKAGYTLKVTGDLTIDCSGSVVIKAGQSLTLKAGTEAKLEAGTALTCKSGTDLNAKAGTNLTTEAGISLTSKASASMTVDGGGMCTIKGGMVKIN